MRLITMKNYLCVFYLLILSSIVVRPLQAVVFTFTNETAYVNALQSFGYQSINEGFEDNGTWGASRSPSAVTSVSSQGVIWYANHPANTISTSGGAAVSGDWGGFDPDHGEATGTISSCDVETPPAECFFHDGLSGDKGSGQLDFSGVGAWVSGFAGAKVAVIVNESTSVEIGQLSGSSTQFFGLIDTAGFTTFEFREVEGKVGDQLFIFIDDVTVGFLSSSQSCIPQALNDITCDGVDDDCNGLLDDGYIVDSSCGIGLCRTDNTPSSCLSGVETLCQPGIPQALNDITCDGVDDNCNGLLDDGYIVDSSCGIGLCRTDNTPSSCLSGVETLCQPGLPQAEDSEMICADGFDNDCDGLADSADQECGGVKFSWLLFYPAIIGTQR